MIIWLTRNGSSLRKEEYSEIIQKIDGFAIHQPFVLPIQKFWSSLYTNRPILVSGVESLSQAQLYSLEIETIEIFAFEDVKSFFNGVRRIIARRKQELFAYVRAVVAPFVVEYCGCEVESLYLKKYGFELSGIDPQNGIQQGVLGTDQELQRLIHFSAHFHDIVYVGAGSGRAFRESKCESDWRDKYIEGRISTPERQIITVSRIDCKIGKFGRLFKHKHYFLEQIDLENLLYYYSEKLFQPILVWNYGCVEIFKKVKASYRYFLFKNLKKEKLFDGDETFQPIFFSNDDNTQAVYLYKGLVPYGEIMQNFEIYKLKSRNYYNNMYIVERRKFEWKEKTCFLNGASLIRPSARNYDSSAIYTLRWRDSNGFPDYVSGMDDILSIQRRNKFCKSLKLIMLSKKKYIGSPTEAASIVLVNFPYDRIEFPDVGVSTMIGLRHVSFHLRAQDSLVHRIADEIKSFGVDVSGHLLFNLIGNVEAVDFREWMKMVLSWSLYNQRQKKDILSRVVRVESGTERDLQNWHSPCDFIAAIEVARRCSTISDENIEWLRTQVDHIRFWLSERKK